MSRPQRTTFAAAATGAIAGLACLILGAWGGTPGRSTTGSLPAARIVRLSEVALAKQRTFVLAGTIRSGAAIIGLRLVSGDGGAVSEGVLDSNAKSVGFVGTIRYIAVHGTFFVDAAAPFWGQFVTAGASLSSAQAAKIVAALSGRWIVLGPSYTKSLTHDLGALTSPRSVATGVLQNQGTVVKRKETMLHGVRALPLSSSGGGTLYVALDGPPLPLQISGSGGGTSGRIVFSYPKSVRIAPPRGARTLAQVTATVVG